MRFSRYPACSSAAALSESISLSRGVVPFFPSHLVSSSLNITYSYTLFIYSSSGRNTPQSLFIPIKALAREEREEKVSVASLKLTDVPELSEPNTRTGLIFLTNVTPRSAATNPRDTSCRVVSSLFRSGLAVRGRNSLGNVL